MTKLAFYQDEHKVEVLDTNGLQRQVAIFPESVPYIVEDLRKADVDFFVAPAPEPAPAALVHFAQAFIATLLVIMLLDALGMLGMVAFAMSVLFEGVCRYADAVGEGWELTVADMKNAIVPQQSDYDDAGLEPIPVRADDEIEYEYVIEEYVVEEDEYSEI